MYFAFDYDNVRQLLHSIGHTFDQDLDEFAALVDKSQNASEKTPFFLYSQELPSHVA